MISTIAITSTMYDYGFTLDSSVKLWLPFWYVPGSSPNITDRSGNGNNATIIGAVPTTLASPAIGWYCDGIDDGFTLSNVFTTNQTGLTILSWVYCHSFDQDAGVAKGNHIYADWNTFAAGAQKGYRLVANHAATNTSQWSFTINDGVNNSSHVSTSMADAVFLSTYQNRWLCVCSSYEASARMKLWLNGSILVADKTAGVLTQMTPETATSDCIAYSMINAAYANFTYGEIAILNRAFSDTELINYYQTTRGRYKV